MKEKQRIYEIDTGDLERFIPKGKTTIKVVLYQDYLQVFDEFKRIMGEDYKGSWIETIEKRHLSTFPNEKEHNSSSKKDCYNHICPNQHDNECLCEYSVWATCKGVKRSPS